MHKILSWRHKLITRILTSEWTLFSLIVGFILFFSFLPMYFQYKITPPGTVYLGFHNSVIDFPMFISEISQGQHGKLTQIIKFTSETQLGTWIHFPNLIAGYLTGPFNIHPVLAYHILRFVSGFILLATVYLFIKLFVKEKINRLLIFLLTVFSGPFPRLIEENGQTIISNTPFLSFYTGFNVLKRWSFIPHDMWKDILFLFVIIFWIKYLNNKKLKHFYFAAFAGFLLGFLSPVHSIVLWTAIVGLIIFLPFNKEINPLKYLKTAFSYILITIPSSIYIYWVFENIPWKIAKIWESIQSYDLSWYEFFMSGGPVIVLALPVIFCILIILIRRKMKIISVNSYFLIAIPIITTVYILSPLHRFLGMNNMRFLAVTLHVFWSILTGLSLMYFAKKLSEIIKNNKFYYPIFIVLILLTILPTIPVYKKSMDLAKKEFDPRYYNVYPPKDFYNGLLWLKDNTNADDVVFCDFIFCNLVPAFGGNTVYIGHYVATVDFARKKKEVEFFYKTTMSPQEAYDYLSSQKIKYVVWSIDEKAQAGDPKKYEFLKLRFNNPLVQIYEVQ